jgi:hypothetical protein
MGVGDVGDVPGWARRRGLLEGGDDGRGGIGEREPGMVDRGRAGKRIRGREQGIGAGSVDYGAWGRHEDCGVHGEGTGGADGLREDRVGIGDIGEVPGGIGCRGVGADDGDGRGAAWQHVSSMDHRLCGFERLRRAEPSRDGIGVDGGARIRHGACAVHGPSARGPDGMRGDRLEVGIICPGPVVFGHQVLAERGLDCRDSCVLRYAACQL